MFVRIWTPGRRDLLSIVRCLSDHVTVRIHSVISLDTGLPRIRARRQHHPLPEASLRSRSWSNPNDGLFLTVAQRSKTPAASLQEARAPKPPADDSCRILLRDFETLSRAPKAPSHRHDSMSREGAALVFTRPVGPGRLHAIPPH